MQKAPRLGAEQAESRRRRRAPRARNKAPLRRFWRQFRRRFLRHLGRPSEQNSVRKHALRSRAAAASLRVPAAAWWAPTELLPPPSEANDLLAGAASAVRAHAAAATSKCSNSQIEAHPGWGAFRYDVRIRGGGGHGKVDEDD